MSNIPDITTYFFSCPMGTPEHAAYPHSSIGIAEGLYALGIPCYSNLNQWELAPNTGKYLFSHHPNITPQDCDIVFLDSEWLDYQYPLPPYVTQKQRNNILVYVDHADGVLTHALTATGRHFDLILKASYNNHAKGYPSNVVPWCYGLTNRIINATAHNITWQERRQVMLSNFRIHHPVRARASRIFYPIINTAFTIDTHTDTFEQPTDPLERFEWGKTGRRHCRSYYTRMQHAQAVSCFGGYYHTQHIAPSKDYRAMQHSNHMLTRIANKLTQICTPKRAKAVFQWDSYRLWEAFASGCLVIHLDFDMYGLQMPVMPANHIHYLGINLDNIASVKTLIAETDHTTWGAIAENGRAWTLEHYAPTALARRLLGMLFPQ